MCDMLLEIFPRFLALPFAWLVNLVESDEVIEDVVEQLFGRAVQEEFEESVQNCADALTEIKV